MSPITHLTGGDDGALRRPRVGAQLPHLHRALLGKHVLGGGAALGRLEGDVGGGGGVALALGRGEEVTTVLD